MEINVIKINNEEIANVKSNEILIKDVQSALDLIGWNKNTFSVLALNT